MEEQSLTTQLNQLTPSNKQQDIGRIIYHLNQLTNFPITDQRISEWSKTIDEVFPELPLEHLNDLVLDYKMGKIEYDQKSGIQNIFLGLRIKFGGIYD